MPPSDYFSEISFLNPLGEKEIPNLRNTHHILLKAISPWSTQAQQQEQPATILSLAGIPNYIVFAKRKRNPVLFRYLN